ncbi:hypothetical protein [Streptomyces zaomyceticus]|uniref:hypothetical protein n=1 Tax=Streptomyces zaomyceticus TaxID=68286 RepID=UPI00367F35CF
MTKAWKRGSAALAAGAAIAVGMVATQPAPSASASAAKGTTATKPVVPTKTVRLMICDKGTYGSIAQVWQGDPQVHGFLAPTPLRWGELCNKYTLVQNQKYMVRVNVWSFEGQKTPTKKIKDFTFKADRPMTVVTLGTVQNPRLERYRK